VLGVPVVVLALVASACTSARTGGQHAGGNGPGQQTSAVDPGSSTPGSGPAPTDSSSSSAPPAAPKPLRLIAAPTQRTDVSPVDPVTVSVQHGTLTSVVLTNSGGKVVKSAMSADKTSWQNSEVLGYDRSYTLVAKATQTHTGDLDPQTRTITRHFSTLRPSNMTMPYFQRPGGYSLENGGTYGVGIVPIVHWDESISDKAAAEKAVTVTTSPHVNGSFYWDPGDSTNKNLYWRPQHFWTPGTKVTIEVNDYGKQMSPGLWGQADAKISFTIGRKQITVADDNAPKVDKVRVYTDGKLVRTMNTSMGKHTGIEVNCNWINFYTLEGTYTVIAHENPAIMSSASYGLPANAEGGYAPEKIYWATKISVDGIYLHELTTTIWYQDNGYDVSHGCLNLNTANATWFYNHSMIGDPVVVRHTGGPKIQVWQGGEWSVPWNQWVAGSALS
jgi:lipoprotein-anchoring transpeptidase ErfK/SrfK